MRTTAIGHNHDARPNASRPLRLPDLAQAAVGRLPAGGDAGRRDSRLEARRQAPQRHVQCQAGGGINSSYAADGRDGDRTRRVSSVPTALPSHSATTVAQARREPLEDSREQVEPRLGAVSACQALGGTGSPEIDFDDGEPLHGCAEPSHPAEWSVLLIDDASKRTAIAETHGHDVGQVLAREPAVATLPSRAMRVRADLGASTTELADSKAKKARNA